MACNGTGTVIRNAHHNKSTYTLENPDTREYAQCGKSGTGGECKSKPCHSCGLTTCDECRIHCVYQSIYTPPDEADELPMLSGFVLLHPEEFTIMSPGQSMMDHVGNETWNVPTCTYHDQGVLDLPLDSTTYACPEAVTDIINCNLGDPLLLKEIPTGGSMTALEIDSIKFPFWEIAERRKRRFCDGCLNNERHWSTPRRCQCTFRERFLDRWLCLRCFVQEDEAAKACRRGIAIDVDSPICSCGRSWGVKGPNVMCLWCLGDVIRPESALSSAP